MSVLRRVIRAIGWVLALLLGWARGAGRRVRRERIVAEGEREPRAELAVVVLLMGVTACAVLFIVAYVLEWGHQTQIFGLALGGAFALLAAAFAVAARHLVVTEEIEEDYSEPDREEEEKLIQIVDESGSRITRKRLLGSAAGAAGAALGAALVVPAVSMGPVLDTESLYDTPWRRGRRLVDDAGRPWSADDIERGTFYTAYPQGADPDLIASPVVVVRLDTDQLRLPPGREGWAPEGILAFSKVCPHAGCAISLYRTPLYPPTSPEPALVCPCHYSTFDPATGGDVIFGPAGRALPQLPLVIDPSRGLRAGGSFSSPPGPSFWGVRTSNPDPAEPD